MVDPLRIAAEPLILALLDQQEDHGYSLMVRLKNQLNVDLSDGSLYPTLKRLEDSGRIAGVWEQPVGERRRKVYRLTPEGRSAVRRARHAWPDFAQRLTALFEPGGAVSEEHA